MSTTQTSTGPALPRWRRWAFWPTPWPADRWDRRLVLLLMVGAAMLAGHHLIGGGFDLPNEPMHALDGMFVRDLVAAASTDRVQTWAEGYYAHFPCLGLVIHWPPMLAILQAPAFALLGPDEAVARGVVAACFAVSIALAYLTGRRVAGRVGGLAAAGLLAASPLGLYWSRHVVTVWPAAMFVLLAVYMAVRFVDEPTWVAALLAGLAALGAYLADPQAGHVALLLAAMPLVRPDRLTAVPWWELLAGVAVAAGAVYFYYRTVADFAAPPQLPAIAGEAQRFLLERQAWLDLPKHIVAVTGPLTLGLAAAALLVLVLTGRWGVPALGVLWIVAAALAGVLPVGIESQSKFWLLLPVSFLAGAGLMAAMPGWTRYTGLVVVLGAAGWQIRQDMQRPAYRLMDYSPAVTWLVEQPDADLVLVDGARECQFVWDVRENPRAAWRIIPLRARQVLTDEAMAAATRPAGAAADRPADGSVVEAAAPADEPLSDPVVALLARYGIRYIAVEWDAPTAGETAATEPSSPVADLRELLTSDPRFELAASWPIEGDPAWEGAELRIYRWQPPALPAPVEAAPSTAGPAPAPTTQPAEEPLSIPIRIRELDRTIGLPRPAPQTQPATQPAQ